MWDSEGRPHWIFQNAGNVIAQWVGGGGHAWVVLHYITNPVNSSYELALGSLPGKLHCSTQPTNTLLANPVPFLLDCTARPRGLAQVSAVTSKCLNPSWAMKCGKRHSLGGECNLFYAMLILSCTSYRRAYSAQHSYVWYLTQGIVGLGGNMIILDPLSDNTSYQIAQNIHNNRAYQNEQQWSVLECIFFIVTQTHSNCGGIHNLFHQWAPP